MKVILLSYIEKLGNKGDVVRVKRGFARNYLIPTGKATTATSAAFSQASSAVPKVVACWIMRSS